MPEGKTPLIIKEFKGKLVTDRDSLKTALGEYDQTKIPFEYALNSVNLEYLKKGGLRTRSGIERYIAKNITGIPRQILKVSNFGGIGQTDRYMILSSDSGTGTNYIYDTAYAGPQFSIVGEAGNFYASWINAFGKVFISFISTDFFVPYHLQSVKIYNGVNGEGRNAKCLAPVIGTFAGVAAAGGGCTPGLHYISVLYETNTGYISSCSTSHLPPNSPLAVTTTIANATINLSNIPTGPAGTSKRHIIMTRIVVNPPPVASPNSGFLGFEPFFAFTIGDNTTTVASLTNPDYALIDSARDYIQNGESISSVVGFAVYGNRLVYIGPFNTSAGGPPVFVKDLIFVSPPNRPEQIITLGSGRAGPVLESPDAILIGQNFSGQLMAGAELNGILYIFKEDSTFAITANNDLSPSEWEEPVLIDSGKGAFPFGVAVVGDNQSPNNDSSLLVAGNKGLAFFNGRFSPISLAEAIWDEFSPNDLRWAKVLVDPIRQMMFMRIGDPHSTDLVAPHAGPNTSIFVANYYYGLDVTSIRWGEFKYTVDHAKSSLATIRDIALREPISAGNEGVGSYFNTLHPLLCLLNGYVTGGGGGNNFRLYSESLVDRDFGVTLLGSVLGQFPAWLYETGYTPNKAGEVYTFGPMKLRIIVSTSITFGAVTGTVTVEKAALDSNTWLPVGSFSPGSLPGKYFSLNVNAFGETMRLRISGSNRVTLDELILHLVETAMDRPRV